MEDARLLITMARENNWKIVLRNLDTGDPYESYLYNDKIDQESDLLYQNLFWISLQVILNSLHKHYGYGEDDLGKDHYIPYINHDDLYEPDFAEAKIITIAEPGKSRLLIKSRTELVLFLTPYNKLVQNAFSFLPDHRVGLISTSHAWKHLKRMSPLNKNAESNFMYDRDSGLTKENIYQVFQDWTEATDNVSLVLAIMLLLSLNIWLGIPQWYASINSTAATTGVKYTCEPIIRGSRRTFKGTFERGMMMGNPVTKTVLHMLHCVADALSTDLLKELYLEKVSSRNTS